MGNLEEVKITFFWGFRKNFMEGVGIEFLFSDYGWYMNLEIVGMVIVG